MNKPRIFLGSSGNQAKLLQAITQSGSQSGEGLPGRAISQ